MGRHLRDEGVDITRAHGRAELGTLHEGPWPARLTVSERRASSFRSELHTHNSSLVFSHPRNRLRGPRPSGPKRGPSGPTGRAWPLEPGQSHWAVTRDGGRRAVLPFLPDDTLSPITDGLPRWAPEHLPGSFICAAPTASVKGAEFIFHNSSARGRVISPRFPVWTLRLREVHHLLSVTQRPIVKVGFGLRTVGGTQGRALPRIHCLSLKHRGGRGWGQGLSQLAARFSAFHFGLCHGQGSSGPGSHMPWRETDPRAA